MERNLTRNLVWALGVVIICCVIISMLLEGRRLLLRKLSSLVFPFCGIIGVGRDVEMLGSG